MENPAERAIAIVGIGAILPDAPNAAAFWQNIINKRYSITEVPPERWCIADYYDPDPKAPDKTYSKIGGWVRGFNFDWKRFRMPPRVAAAMDEGQQWALTIAADALADYGYPERPLDTERTAVVLGTAMGGELHYVTHLRIAFPEFAHALESVSEFSQLPASVRQTILSRWHDTIDAAFPPITEDSMPGELPNIVSGRVANVLNLRGPNFITDAACASSFAAIEAAMEMLVEHKVDAAISGGVDHNMGASTFVKFCKIGALSATGTRPFGEGADGFVMGEGAAAFLLKRLEDAERDGDKIYAVIRGVGGASDGKGKGITAPNPIGPRLAMERAWEDAGRDRATATLIEAHGTSTRVGDVVEVESLAEVFKGARRHSIALGSVKSNIGHLKAGAGAAGLLKATLALYHKILPPTLNASLPNPNIDFDQTPFYLNHEAREWTLANGTPRRCGVSAYGFGGTNFHVVLEEHVPGLSARKFHSFSEDLVKVQGSRGAGEQGSGGAGERVGESASGRVRRRLADLQTRRPAPLRGILALGAGTVVALQEKLDETVQRVLSGWMPALALPEAADIQAPERLVIDFGSQEELLDRLRKAQKVMGLDSAPAWKAVQAQGIFRGNGNQAGKIAFLFPGQGSQYVNMGRELAQVSPVVAEVFAEADKVMTPILGRPLTEYIFVDPDDKEAVQQAQFDLMQTAITQPAMLTLDIAIYRLLESYGFRPDMVMGHSLGEYAALIAAGTMPFADALEAAAARGSEMTRVSMDDNGRMAAVLAPYDVVEATLDEIDGYIVPANINSRSQCVIGGASKAVEQAVQIFEAKGYKAVPLPVSHAFHTRIVAPASVPLRQVLDRLAIRPPQLPLVANVTGDFYPSDVEAIKDILQQQIAAPVQWVKGLERLYNAGARTFVEVGPKRALHGFACDVFSNNPDVTVLLTNHPKSGELPTFNQALCGLYAAGYGEESGNWRLEIESLDSESPVPEASPSQWPEVNEMKASTTITSNGTQTTVSTEALAQLLNQALQHANPQSPIPNLQSPISNLYDRNAPPAGSIVISGTGLGLPGAEKAVMDPENARRILRGEQFIDLIPERFRKQMVAKRITRLVKTASGNGSFEAISDADAVIKLAGRAGSFDLAKEYGVSEKLIEALDITTQLAMAAGLDALREAGIPLVQTYRRTTTGSYLPDRWLLPEALRDETGVIFASAFPGGDRFAEDFKRYYSHQNRREQLEMLEDLRGATTDPETLKEIQRRISELRDALAREPYTLDRRFIFRILAMGHSQFAEYIGARGPNTQVNAACASTTQAIAMAEDWIRDGRCRRVIVIAADNVTGDNLMEWVGAGFLAVGAAATDDRVEEAALPFDRRRHGAILGMGACALVVESEDVVRQRGMRGIVEVLSTETRNSAFHGSRLDVDHIATVMNDLVTAAERRYGLNRYAMAPQLVFMSHETYTPARGGSASAEVAALRHTFGEATDDIIVANTKGFTGHPMGVGVEDVIALKILEYGIVPPVPNYKEVDDELGILNLSRGGRYPVQYALHLAAGFGSQIALTLIRRIPGGLNRIHNRPLYQRWMDDISGYDRAETEVEKRVLRIKAQGVPTRSPAANTWQYGTGPVLRTQVSNGAAALAPQPARMNIPEGRLVTEPALEPGPVIAAPQSKSAPMPEPVAVVAEVVTEPVVVTALQPPTTDPVVEKVLAIVAAQTGYPTEMLDLDLDLEADLGVDTVKQAETFAAIRRAFDIPRRDDLQLRDYPTLNHVINFVRQNSGQLAVNSEQLTVNGEQLAVGSGSFEDSGQAVGPSKTQGEQPAVIEMVIAKPALITDQVLAIVAEQTGYPTEMLELDLDLEADLGVDTVKQAETFMAIRHAFDIPRQDNLQLRDYPTLAKVIEFVEEMRPDLAAARLAVGSEQSAVGSEQCATEGYPVGSEQPAVIETAVAEPSPITEKVLAIVAEQTGYPTEMLELDLDLEADLGVDTVKQAETFAAIRQAFDIPRLDNLQLRDYPTLGHVIGFVEEMRPDLASEKLAAGSEQLAVGSELAAEPSSITDDWLLITERVPRRVPVPSLRPSLDLCKPTGVTLDENSRVVVMMDGGGVGKTLAGRLEKLGVTVLAVEASPAAGELEAQLEAWLADGPIHGVYWLPALDVEPNLEEMTLASWRELNRQRVKNLYVTMRALYDVIREPGTFLLAATRLGGLHGYGPEAAVAPLGGAVTGFTKAYKREHPGVLVKAVDFEASRKTAQPADALIAETLADPGVVEVGCWQNQRYAVTLVEQPAGRNEDLQLDGNAVFLVTGAAGGITSAIVADLAAASSGTFYLLDLAPAPEPTDARVSLFRQSRDALKQQLIEEAKAAGERPTPVAIEKQLMAVERQEAALRAVESVEAAGGTACYRSVDLLDGQAVAAIIDEIRQQHGRIDVLIHAAGLEISRTLPDKDPAQFDLVFDVKADGFFNLLRASKGIPVGATVAFSSVAGCFGNSGQSDYSAANDLLCKVSSSLRRWRPETRGIVIDWTAWADIGMATRGSIPKIMEMAGIEMLPPEVGVPTVRRELIAGGQGEIVVAGALGVLTEEWDANGGLDVDKANAWLAARKPQWLMIGQVKAARLYGGLEAETTLDPRVQPFLYDHAMDGTPLLPGVMGTEAFAELATALAPGYAVAAVTNEQFQAPFKFYRMEPQTLYLSAMATPVNNGDLLVHTVLKSVRKLAQPGLPDQEKVHFTADVHLTCAPVAPPAQIGDAPFLAEGERVSAEAIYRIYFHGPAYQVLEWVQIDGDNALGLMAENLPPNTDPADAASLIAPRLVELCFQTAGIWEMKNRGVLALPLAIQSVTAYQQAEAADGKRLYARVEAANGGQHFNAQVVDEVGNVYVTLSGYRTVQVPGIIEIGG